VWLLLVIAISIVEPLTTGGIASGSTHFRISGGAPTAAAGLVPTSIATLVAAEAWSICLRVSDTGITSVEGRADVLPPSSPRPAVHRVLGPTVPGPTAPLHVVQCDPAPFTSDLHV
jgi:hypothetical protein